MIAIERLRVGDLVLDPFGDLGQVVEAPAIVQGRPMPGWVRVAEIGAQSVLSTSALGPETSFRRAGCAS